MKTVATLGLPLLLAVAGCAESTQVGPSPPDQNVNRPKVAPVASTLELADPLGEAEGESPIISISHGLLPAPADMTGSEWPMENAMLLEETETSSALDSISPDIDLEFSSPAAESPFNSDNVLLAE